MKEEHPSLASHRFKIRCNFLKNSKTWDFNSIVKYQEKNLRRLIRLAYNNSDFYRGIFEKNSLKPCDIQKLSDLDKLPIVTKSDLQAAGIGVATSRKLQSITERTTGGSTGSPLVVYANNTFYAKDKANTYHYVNQYGESIFKSKSVRIYGNKVLDINGEQTLFAYNAEGNRLEVNVFMVAIENIHRLYNEFKRHSPKYIHGRASAVISMTKLMIHENINGIDIGIKNIFVDGENVRRSEQDLIENYFNAKLVNVYGHTEGSLFGFPCRHTSKFHYQPVTGIIQIVQDPEKFGLDKSFRGTAVVTGLNNFFMPFIRYATGDYVSKLEKGCSVCGHSYFVSNSLIGRAGQVIYDAEFREIPLASLMYNYDDVDWGKVKHWQVVQNEPGKIELTICPIVGLSDSDEKNLLGDLYKQLQVLSGGIVEIQIKIGTIEPNPRGKIRDLIQNIEK